MTSALNSPYGLHQGSNIDPIDLVNVYQQIFAKTSHTEQRHIKAYLNSIISEYCARCKQPQKFSVEFSIVDSIAKFLAADGASGICCRGNINPGSISECLLESKRLFSSATVQNGRSRWVEGGDSAELFYRSPDLLRHLCDATGLDLLPSGHCGYLYYSGIDSGINPHFDRNEYSINVIAILEHIYLTDPNTQLVAWLPGSGFESCPMDSGEWVALFADRTIHGRIDCCIGECITVLSCGFNQIL